MQSHSNTYLGFKDGQTSKDDDNDCPLALHNGESLTLICSKVYGNRQRNYEVVTEVSRRISIHLTCAK